MAYVDWMIRTKQLGTCSCDYGCPCEFNAPPTRLPCEGVMAMEIPEGYYGDVRLDGLELLMLLFEEVLGLDEGPRRRCRPLHGGLLLAAPAEVFLFDRPFIPGVGVACLVVVAISMALRYWCVMTLGRRWNTRIVILPGVPVITGGPYRFLRHPNYLAVVLEVATLPMIHTAWVTALLFSLTNVVILWVRITVEEFALRTHCSYESELGDKPRLMPFS